MRLLRTLAVEAVFSSAAAVNRTTKSTEGFSQWGGGGGGVFSCYSRQAFSWSLSEHPVTDQ